MVTTKDEFIAEGKNNQTVKLPFDIEMRCDDSMNTFKNDKILETQTPWGETVTRLSSSKLADGAAAAVLMNEEGLKR